MRTHKTINTLIPIRDDNARRKQTCGPFIRNIKWITKTMCKRQRESNIYFIIWMEIDTCCYRDTIQCKKIKYHWKYSNSDMLHSMRQIRSNGIRVSCVYSPYCNNILLFRTCCLQFIYFFSPFFRTFEHAQAPAAPMLMLSLCIVFLCFISFNLWRNVLFMSSFFLFNIMCFFAWFTGYTVRILRPLYFFSLSKL